MEPEKDRFISEAPPAYPGTQQPPKAPAPGFVVTGNAAPVAGNVNEAILAAEAVNSAIHQNGRNPVTVVCPTCKNTAVTETTEIPNTALEEGRTKMVNIFFGGIAAVLSAVIILAAAVGGSLIPLAVLPVFLLFLLVGYCVMKRVGSNAAKMYGDVEHRCSSCHVMLGVSSGAQLLAQMQTNNRRRYNRMNLTS